METFYTGKEHGIYMRRFDAIHRYLKLEEGCDSSKAAAYRAMIDKLYAALPDNYKKFKGGVKNGY